jgi:hypothetical protein
VSTQATAMPGGPYNFILFGCRTRNPGGSSPSQQKPIPILIFILIVSSNVHVASCSTPLGINRLRTLSLSYVLHATPIVSKVQRALQPRVEYARTRSMAFTVRAQCNSHIPGPAPYFHWSVRPPIDAGWGRCPRRFPFRK